MFLEQDQAQSTRAAVATFLLASAALFLGSVGAGCANTPSMGIDDLCTKACGTASPSLVQLCKDTLRDAAGRCGTLRDAAGGAAATAEATVYAIAAAKQASGSYQSTIAKADELANRNPPLPADGEKSAYDACKVKYGIALKNTVDVAARLSRRSLGGGLRQEYVDARLNVRGCGDDLAKFPSSPLIDMNASDKNLALLALDIAGLIAQ